MSYEAGLATSTKEREISRSIFIKHYEDDTNARTVTIIRCGKDVIGVIAGSTKYLVTLSDMSYEFLRNCRNEYLQDLLKNGMRVTPTQMDVYVEHYVDGLGEV